jgi:hypothetical protein
MALVPTVVCSGDRRWADVVCVHTALSHAADRCGGTVRIVAGDCAGLDTIALKDARDRGWPHTRITADWKKYGARAGPERNKRLLKDSPTADVYVFHNDPAISKGTKDMVAQALADRRRVFWWTSISNEPTRLLSPSQFSYAVQT